MENSQLVFAGVVGKVKEEAVNLEALYAKIGQLEMERDLDPMLTHVCGSKKACRRADYNRAQVAGKF